MSDLRPSTGRVLVWDLPTRLLHWLLAGSFLGAFVVAHLFEHRPGFVLHMLLGAIAAVAVLLRLGWALVGSRHARLGGFAFGPGAVARYLRDALGGAGARFAGHNPAGAWVALAVFASTLGVAVTGALIGRGGHAVKEVHEGLVVATLVLVGAHLLGLALHAFRHRENPVLGMIDGRKAADPAQAIPRAHGAAALAALGIVAVAAIALLRGYDPAARREIVLGQEIQLGEREGQARERRSEHREGHQRHGDHDR
jgi:cytochrome b